jgi:hypothetical protein
VKWALFTLVLAAAGCGDPSNTQYLPIGSRCTSSGQCGTNPFDCLVTYPGGYCERPCTTDGDCPQDAVCDPTPHACRRKCKTPDDCRTSEGYTCLTAPGTTTVCTIP